VRKLCGESQIALAGLQNLLFLASIVLSDDHFSNQSRLAYGRGAIFLFCASDIFPSATGAGVGIGMGRLRLKLPRAPAASLVVSMPCKNRACEKLQGMRWKFRPA
jgi:hypothetical protein